MMKTIEYYLGLSYPIELIEDKEEGGYFAQHPDLEGCAAQGETAEEAVANLATARRLWMKTRLEDGLPVPEPPPEQPSGKFLLRMMPELHALLMRLAQGRNVSLNHLLNTVLAEYVGGAGYRDQLPKLCEKLARLTAEARSSQMAVVHLAVAAAEQQVPVVSDLTSAKTARQTVTMVDTVSAQGGH